MIVMVMMFFILQVVYMIVTTVRQEDLCLEFVRLRNFINRLQKYPLVGEFESLLHPILPHGTDFNAGGRPTVRAMLHRQPESRRHVLFKNVDTEHAVAGVDPFRLIMVMMMVATRLLA